MLKDPWSPAKYWKILIYVSDYYSLMQGDTFSFASLVTLRHAKLIPMSPFEIFVGDIEKTQGAMDPKYDFLT